MTTVTDTSRTQIDQTAPQDALQSNQYQGVAGAVPNWVEDSPSYLAPVQALLAGLSEADKDAIHASLEEE